MADDKATGHITARLQGTLYAVLHATVRHTFLGPTIRGWLVNLPLFVALFMFLLGWPTVWPIVIAVLALALRLLYWKARRDGYVRFLAHTAQQPEEGTVAVADNEKVTAKATGVFSVKDLEEYVLSQPAEYWRVPMGDHAIMVRRSARQFLYQFVRRDSLEQIEAGLLCRGPHPQMALAITYLTSWGPESEDANFMFYAPSDESDPSRQKRKMFLSFENEMARDSVWQKLLQDDQIRQNEDS